MPKTSTAVERALNAIFTDMASGWAEFVSKPDLADIRYSVHLDTHDKNLQVDLRVVVDGEEFVEWCSWGTYELESYPGVVEQLISDRLIEMQKKLIDAIDPVCLTCKGKGFV